MHGDGSALEWADGRFTGAICFTMLHHVPTAALQDQVFADWNDTVGTTFAEKGDAVSATEDWDKRVRDFAKVQGFTTSE